MASIGGLDLGYGSQTQIVRTNLLCVAVAATGVSKKVGADHYHNTIKEGLKGSMLEPDFTYFYDDGTALAGSGYVEATADAIFDLDPANDGTADSTALAVGGLLRDIRQVPLCPGSAHHDAVVAHSAFGTAHTLANSGDISGNMMLQGVLNVGAISLDLLDASTDAGLFQDDAPASPAATANEVGGIFAGLVQASAMETQWENMMAATSSGKNYGNLGGSGATGISTGARLGPYTLDLSTALVQLDGVAGTGATAANIDASAADGDTFETIATEIDEHASIISVLSLAKVC